MNHQRRKLLVYSLAAAGILSAPAARVYGTPALQVENVTRLYPVKVGRIVSPSTCAEVRQAVMAWPGRIAVGGARYSMGGQIGIEGGLHIDMRRMNGLVWLDPQGMVARVQAGMRWRDLQDHLDPLGLSVRTMQS